MTTTVKVAPDKLLVQTGGDERDYQAMMYKFDRDMEFRDLDSRFFPLYGASRKFSMTSVPALYELYKSVQYIARAGIPGALAECGVWRGGSVMMMAYTLLQEKKADRDLYLFDTFEGLPEPDPAVDVDFEGNAAASQWFHGWARCARERVVENVAATGYPRELIHCVEGMVEDTLPELLVPQHLALLRVDTDWHSSTKIVLETLWPRLANGGVLILDDYGHWQGARLATDNFFADKPVKMNRVDYAVRSIQKAGKTNGAII